MKNRKRLKELVAKYKSKTISNKDFVLEFIDLCEVSDELKDILVLKDKRINTHTIRKYIGNLELNDDVKCVLDNLAFVLSEFEPKSNNYTDFYSKCIYDNSNLTLLAHKFQEYFLNKYSLAKNTGV